MSAETEIKHRILVVGGDSRAAQAFRKRAAANPAFAVTVLSRIPVEPYPSETHLELKDCFSPPNAVLAAADAVINFQGVVHAPSWNELLAINAEGPHKLAVRAKAAGVSQFVHLSSLSIFGLAEDIDNNTPIAPITAYGRSKAAAEQMLTPLAGDGFGLCLLRLPIIYGPKSGEKLHQLARLMTRFRTLPVPRHLNERSVVHVDNLAAAIETIVAQKLVGIHYATDPQAFTIQSLATAIAEGSARKVRLIRFPSPFFTLLRQLHPSIYASLYGKSLIRSDCICPVDPTILLPLPEALKDLLPIRSTPHGR